MPNDKEFELDDLESFSFDDLSLDETLDEAPPAAEPASGEDPFGVWVKSAPEDVGSEVEAVPAPVADSMDSLPEEDFLSSEELANLDDSFDFVTVSEEPMEGETPLEDEIAFLSTPEALAAEKAEPTPASFDEVSLDDFVSFDDVAVEEAPELGETLSVNEGPHTEEDLSEEFLDIDIDIEDDIGDEELEIIEGGVPRVAEETEISLDTFSAQDVDLSEFGDFEEVSPVAQGPLAGAEDLPEVMDIPELEDRITEASMVDDGFFEETVLEDTVLEESLPHLVDEGPVTIDLEPDDQTDLDHILALEEDLTSGIRESEPLAASPSPTPTATASAAPSSDLAALILGKIEQELSSIKQEISELKKEVTHLRVAPEAPARIESEAEVTDGFMEVEAEVPEPVAETKPHGFFDEEDDETIALTGDELDNILSTAEISEGEEQGLSLDEDLLGMDAEGNLVAPTVEVPATEDGHVTDEEFLAGTALDLNEPDPLAESDPMIEESLTEESLGIPESIELEEGLPEGLDEGQTEDLLGDAVDDFEVTPLPEGVLEGAPQPLEIPFDDDIGLELEDSAPLAPELNEENDSAPLGGFDTAALDDLPPLDEAEGWSPATLPSVDEVHDEIELGLEEDALPVFEETLPPAPVVPAAAAPEGPLSAGLKDELKAVLQYMDKLLASLPDDKIQEFAESEHFEVYKRLFEELGLIE